MEDYKLDKMTAAERQLDAAIYLMLFTDYNEATHTVISAAKGLLYDLSKEVDNPAVKQLQTAEAKYIKPEHLGEFQVVKRRLANFLKHADRDPEGVVENVDIVSLNELDLFLAISAYQGLVKALPLKYNLAAVYCICKHPAIYDMNAHMQAVGADPTQVADLMAIPAGELRETAKLAYSKLP
jgi:hypothetical protein